METKKKWYQTTGGIIALLILFFPVGLYLMWKHASWNKTAKWIVTGVFAFFVLVSAFSPDSTKTASTTTQNPSPTAQETQAPTEPEPTTQPELTTQPKAQATKAPVKATNTPAAQTQQPAQGETVSQRNAVRKAKSYISFSGFSRDGLVAQLEYEKFSRADAEYGADNSGANWNEEAAQKAKSYMDMMGYSRDGLIQQLLYEKFTQAQAEYGANSVGL